MALETGLEGRPWYFGAVVGLVATAALVFAGHRFQLKGMLETRVEQQRRLEQLEERIARGRAAQAKLPQFRAEVAALEAELEKLLEILPPSRDVPDLLRRFRALTEQGDFVLSKFTPGAEIQREFYNEWPISLELEGTYHELARLFDRMSRFSRIFNVDNLRIAEQSEGQHSINARFTAKTFVYKPPRNPAGAKAAGAAKAGAANSSKANASGKAKP